MCVTNPVEIKFKQCYTIGLRQRDTCPGFKTRWYFTLSTERLTDRNSIIKGKENPWFKLVYCDKRIFIRYTVD